MKTTSRSLAVVAILSFALPIAAQAPRKTDAASILNNMFRPNQAPIVSVIAVVMVVISIVPIYIAQRLSGSEQTRR